MAGSTHKRRYPESEFHVNVRCLVLLFWHEHYIAVYTAERFAVRGCVCSMDQVRDTNRQCHKVSENLQRACREAVQCIGMCHNARKQQQSLHPCVHSLSSARSVIPFCLHLSFCLSNSGSFFLSGVCPYLSLAFLFSLSVSRHESENDVVHLYIYI